MLSYTSVDTDLISFRPNNEAIVYMKSAGTNPELWFVKINEKSGFANSKFLREYKIIEKNSLIVVSYEPKAQVQPNRVKQAHEVIEGTTIYTTEAAVNKAQEEATTESPVNTSNEERTPSLENSGEILNEKFDTKTSDLPNVETNENSVPESNDETKLNNIGTETTTNLPEQIDTSIESDFNELKQNVESPSLDLTKSTEDLEGKESTSTEQLDSELPKQLTSEGTAQQLLSTISGSLSSKNLSVTPDTKEFSSVNESEPTEGVEQNVSSPNPNAENLKVAEEMVTDTSNVANGNNNPLNEPPESILADQSDNEPLRASVESTEDATLKEQLEDQPPTMLPIIKPTASEPDITPPVAASDTASTQPPLETLPPSNLPLTPETAPVLLPSLESASIIPAPNTNQNLPPPEVLPVIPPVSENVPNLPPPETVPVVPPVSENVPNLPPPETAPALPPAPETIHTYPFVKDTIPALPPTTSGTIPPLYSETPQSIPDNRQVLETYTTTSTPDYNSEEAEKHTTTELPLVQDQSVENENILSTQESEDIPSSTTESPLEVEDTQGFISNMLSTMADIWPTSSEAPPPIYNTEDYPSYDSEKSETTGEISEGFSFMKYIMSFYFSVMGTSDEAKSLFASVGKYFFFQVV